MVHETMEQTDVKIGEDTQVQPPRSWIKEVPKKACTHPKKTDCGKSLWKKKIGEKYFFRKNKSEPSLLTLVEVLERDTLKGFTIFTEFRGLPYSSF